MASLEALTITEFDELLQSNHKSNSTIDFFLIRVWYFHNVFINSLKISHEVFYLINSTHLPSYFQISTLHLSTYTTSCLFLKPESSASWLTKLGHHLPSGYGQYTRCNIDKNIIGVIKYFLTELKAHSIKCNPC